MITYQELHEQIHQITEISNVFLYLIENRKMCDSKITCDLFFDYVEKVKAHLEVEDKSLYTVILKGGDDRARKTAEKFLSGSVEIKRIFQDYLKKWSRKEKHKLVIANYPEFINETRDMFELVLNRFQDETEQLYPLARKISGNIQQVA
jgi:hemerythrin-like domain-containing protein